MIARFALPLAALAGALVACSGGEGEMGHPTLRRDPGPAADGGAPASGGASGAAKAYFVDTAFASFTPCRACHVSGGAGAPKILADDANAAYAALDAAGLVNSQSLLLTKGVHAGGAAPALAGDALATVRHWLELEGEERAGSAAPDAVYAALAGCMDKTLFARIDLCSEQTKPRPGENGNQCTGCKFEYCSNCHTSGGQQTGFWCSTTTVNGRVTTDVDDTFASTQTMPYIQRFFGLSGSTPVPSNAIADKSAATKTATSANVHPWFELDINRTKAIDAFVSDTIAKYTSGKCGQP